MSRLLLLLSCFFNLKDDSADARDSNRRFSFKRQVQKLKRFFRRMLPNDENGSRMELTEYNDWIRMRNQEPGGVDVCGKMAVPPIPAPRLSLQQNTKNLDNSIYDLPNNENAQTRKPDASQDHRKKIPENTHLKNNTLPKSELTVPRTTELLQEPVEEPVMASSRPQNLDSYSSWIKTRNAEIGGSDFCGKMAVPPVPAPRLSLQQNMEESDQNKNKIALDEQESSKENSSEENTLPQSTEGSSNNTNAAIIPHSVLESKKFDNETKKEKAAQSLATLIQLFKLEKIRVEGVDVCGKMRIPPEHESEFFYRTSNMNGFTQKPHNHREGNQRGGSFDPVYFGGSGQNLNNTLPIHNLSQLCAGQGMTYAQLNRYSADTSNNGSQTFHARRPIRRSGNLSQGHSFSSNSARARSARFNNTLNPAGTSSSPLLEEDKDNEKNNSSSDEPYDFIG